MPLISLYGVVTYVDVLLICFKRLFLTSTLSTHGEEAKEPNITPRTCKIKVDIECNHYTPPKSFVGKVETRK